MRKINIITNHTEAALTVEYAVRAKLEKAGFTVTDIYSFDAELNVCIGGDGVFLNTVQEYGFPTIPFVGINTGHLGFFQELYPEDVDNFIASYLKGNYNIQELSTVKATFGTSDEEYEHRALNEVVVRGSHTNHSTHLDISIGDSFMETFSGDGIVVSTPAGSTAYNYSLRGGIIDPRIKALQVTPIAPMNTTAYRSFSSSMLVPMDVPINVKSVTTPNQPSLTITYDNQETSYHNIEWIRFELSKEVISLIRFENYDFWDKVKTKFL